MKKGKPKRKAKPPPAPAYGVIDENTLFVCRHGVDTGERCAQCRQARQRSCLILLVGIFLFFTLTIATMHPANKRAMCATMGARDFVPLICQGT